MELSFPQQWSRDCAQRCQKRNLSGRYGCQRPRSCERLRGKSSAAGKMLLMSKLLQLAMQLSFLRNHISREITSNYMCHIHTISDYTHTHQITPPFLGQLPIIPSTRQWQKPLSLKSLCFIRLVFITKFFSGVLGK